MTTDIEAYQNRVRVSDGTGTVSGVYHYVTKNSVIHWVYPRRDLSDRFLIVFQVR